MKLFFDTEFNGFGGELISIGIVTEDGSEFYEELEIEGEYTNWVEDSVVPYLTGDAISKKRLQEKLSEFLNHYYFHEGPLHFYATWPEDIVHLHNLLMTGPGECISVIDDLTTTIYRVPPEDATMSEIPHNALEDAKALRTAYLLNRPWGELQ